MNREQLDYYKEAIRARVSISQVMDRYTGLKPNIHGFYSCPLHKEKTASFKIDEQKGLYYCFGCGQGGDIYKFMQQYLNLDFSEAIKTLDRDFALGITGERISVKAQIAVREAKRKRALELQAKANKNAIYNDLCAQYKVINETLKILEPLTDNWGKMIARKAWLEYEMDKAMEGICK